MADMNQESIQQKIQIARRDAEALKDRIKRKKDELADTTRMSTPDPVTHCAARKVMPTNCVQFAMSRETVSRPCRALR
jgi:hypothetical protein